MTKSEERRIRNLLATRVGGPLYKLYYKGTMCQPINSSEMMLSKFRVFERLGIDHESMSYSDRAFVNRQWNIAMQRFRRRAWDLMQPWGTVRVKQSNGTTIWLHGYTLDPARQEAMISYKHWNAVNHYRAEQRQSQAISQAMGEDSQIELIPQSELISFEMDYE